VTDGTALTGGGDGSGWRKKKGGGARMGQLGPKGWAEWASSKEKEHGPQGGCGPKYKWAAETIFDFKQGFWIQNQRVQILLNWSHTKINLNKLFEDFSILQLLQNWFKYSYSNKGFKQKAFKSIQKRISKLNSNLF
jgi:hypothetical protein